MALTALAVTLLLAFALPAIHSGARGVPIGVVAPAGQAEQVGQQVPGVDVTTYADPRAAREAILDREVYGAVVIEDDGSVETLVASAASPPAAAVVEQIGAGVAATTGAEATVTDLRAFPDDDPRGVGLSAGALPLALGGWIAAVVILLVVHTPVFRVLTALGFAVVGGFAMTATLRFVTGTFDDAYLLTSLGATLGIAATSVAVLGLRSLLGGAGIAIAAVALILLGNPLSGLSSAPEMLPSPWGAIGQLLPPGATGSLLRSLAFFDGAGALQPLVVLSCWLAGGAVLYAIALRRERGDADAAAPEPGDRTAVAGAHG
ncbi:hypothetical protein [Modestobacter roseus]|uniref:hypothetical protein n=1 Tax=Modestobacter roseus TaxID=1181884 RepID=UPI001886224C|nr:hypothetical protein [Modestobacter roseus]